MSTPISRFPAPMSPARPVFGTRQHQRNARRIRELREENDRLTARLTLAETATHQLVHDLRNEVARMHSMLALMNVCKEKILVALKERFGDRAVKIFGSGERSIDNMTVMLGELTDLYSQKPRLEEFSIAQLGSEWEQVLSPLSHQFPKVHISVELKEGLQKVQLDRVKMNRVIVNMVKNACEAIRDNNHQAGTVRLKIRPEGEQLIIEICDTGPGMTEAARKKLFTRGNTTKEYGHGLGLINCKELVELHGGSIMTASALGQGTVFRISLPINGPGRQ